MKKATVVAFVVLALPASHLFAVGGGPTKVLLTSRAEAARATDLLVGAGIILPDGRTTSPLDGPSGQLVWKQYRDQTDEYGIRHVFYRQFLKPTGPIAAVLPARYYVDGIQLPDTAIGLHFEKDGTLGFVYGHQLTAAQAGNFPKLNASQAAAYAALAAVIRSGDYVPFDPSLLDAAARTKWEDSAELSLRWHVPSSSLKLAWRIVVSAAKGRGLGRIPIIDADTGDLLSFDEVAASATPCQTDSETKYWGTAYPQWGDYHNPRSVPATLDDGNLTFEAHWPRELPYNPPIQVWKGLPSTTPEAQRCSISGSAYKYFLSLITIPKSDPNTPYFGNNTPLATCPCGSPPTWFPIEREVGDVLYATSRVFRTTYQFGWNGYKGLADIALGDPARIAIDDVNPNYANNTFFMYTGDDRGFPAVPPDTVVLGSLNHNWDYRKYSACGDMVAHEWGHGICKYSAFPTYASNPSEAGQLTEGLADVFAHMVTHSFPDLMPAVGWNLFDQCREPRNQRSASSWMTWDFWPYPAKLCYYSMQNVWDYNASAWRQCPGSISTGFVTNHQAGHMLPVALYLLADGAATGSHNPAYGVPTEWNAPSTVVPALGVSKAGTIIFHAVVYYATSTTRWGDLPALAVYAAFTAFSSCPGSNALVEQIATAKAFEAIGYPYAGRYGC